MIADGFPLNPDRVKFRSSSILLELRFFVREQVLAADQVDEKSRFIALVHMFTVTGCGVEIQTVS